MNNDIILESQDISKAFFGVYAVQNVSWRLTRGHVLGLIGQNGAGKSTLMNILGGVVRADSGEMILNGQPHHPRKPSDAMRAGIAFIHQELNLFTNLSIAENIFIELVSAPGPFSVMDRRTSASAPKNCCTRSGWTCRPTCWSKSSRRASGSWSRSPRR